MASGPSTRGGTRDDGGPIAAAELGFDEKRLARVRELMERDLDSDLYDGISVAVGRRGELAALETVGYSDHAQGTPPTAEQRVLPFSISKQFVSTVGSRSSSEACSP